MKLDSLSATGTCGGNFSHALQGLNFFCGPNWSGKSTRLNVLRALLLGFIPELGKTNPATFEICEGSVLSLSGRFDDGTQVAREFSRDRKDSIGLENIVVPKFLDETPIVALNKEEYFKLKGVERTRYIFRNATLPPGASLAEVLKQIEALVIPEGEHQKAAFAELVAMVKKEMAKEGVTLAEVICALTDKPKGAISVYYKENSLRAKDSVGAVRTLSEIMAQQEEFSADTKAGLKKEMDALQAVLDDLNAKRGEFAAKNKAADKAEARRKELEVKLKQPAKDNSVEITEKKALVARIEGKLGTEELVDLKPLQKERDALGTDLTKRESEILQKRKRLAEILTTISELAEATECNYCGCKTKGWKARLESTYQDEKGELDLEIKPLQAVHDEKVAAWLKVAATIKAHEATAKEYDSVREKLATAKQELTALENVAIVRAALEDELKRVQETIRSAPSEDDQTAVDDSLVENRAKMTALEARQEKALKLTQDLSNAQKASNEHTKYSAIIEVAGIVGIKLKEIQAAMIDTLFKGLLDDMNYFTNGILPFTLAYHDGELGYFKNGAFVTTRTFSGTQRVLTFVANAAALSMKTKYKVAILDEFDIDADNFNKICDRLASAVNEGKLDQVFMAHTAPPELLLPAWNVFELKGAK